MECRNKSDAKKRTGTMSSSANTFEPAERTRMVGERGARAGAVEGMYSVVYYFEL